MPENIPPRSGPRLPRARTRETSTARRDRQSPGGEDDTADSQNDTRGDQRQSLAESPGRRTRHAGKHTHTRHDTRPPKSGSRARRTPSEARHRGIGHGKRPVFGHVPASDGSVRVVSVSRWGRVCRCPGPRPGPEGQTKAVRLGDIDAHNGRGEVEVGEECSLPCPCRARESAPQEARAATGWPAVEDCGHASPRSRRVNHPRHIREKDSSERGGSARKRGIRVCVVNSVGSPGRGTWR